MQQIRIPNSHVQKILGILIKPTSVVKPTIPQKNVLEQKQLLAAGQGSPGMVCFNALSAHSCHKKPSVVAEVS